LLHRLAKGYYFVVPLLGQLKPVPSEEIVFSVFWSTYAAFWLKRLQGKMWEKAYIESQILTPLGTISISHTVSVPNGYIFYLQLKTFLRDNPKTIAQLCVVLAKRFTIRGIWYRINCSEGIGNVKYGEVCCQNI